MDADERHAPDEQVSAGLAETVALLVNALAPAPVPQARPGHSLIGDLGYHSMRLMELIFDLEDLFSMDSVILEQAPPISTLGELTAYLSDKIESGAAIAPEPTAVGRYLSELPPPED